MACCFNWYNVHCLLQTKVCAIPYIQISSATLCFLTNIVHIYPYTMALYIFPANDYTVCTYQCPVVQILFHSGYKFLSFYFLPLNYRMSPAEFIVPFHKYMESIKNNYSIGLRFKMRFEGEEAPEQR